MAFKRPWLEFSLGWSDEKAVYWWLFEVVLHGKDGRGSQIETFLTSSGWIQLSGGADSWKRGIKMSVCHDRWYHFCVLVFMLPLLAQSSSSELNGASQDAVSSWFLEQTLVFCTWNRKYFLWHSGSPTPVFLSTTLRIISACLVFGDWEGLLVWCRGVDWRKAGTTW